jgi:type VI secretion system secreted protein VgrG
MSPNLSFPDSSDPGFDLMSFELIDEMSALFSLALEVQSHNHNIEISSLIGQRVQFEPDSGSLLQRVTGIIREVRAVSSETTGMTRYELFVVPPLWLTTRRVNHRIFQDRSVVQVVEDVLSDYGGRIPPPVRNLQQSYAARGYTTQYGESDYDFMSRLLAEEGISSHFNHAAESKWSLVDRTDSLTPEYGTPVPYVETNLAHASPLPVVLRAEVRAEIETSAVAVQDYDHLNPSFTIQARATARGAELFLQENDLEVYDVNVGEVRSQEQAAELAQRLLAGSRALGRRLELTTNFALGAGTRITLTGHPRDDANGSMLVIRSIVAGQPTAFSHRLVAVDAATLFRPRRPRRPRIIGTQTAFVVATTAGDEIDADELGQVKIEFRWDRRGKRADASRYVRVSQAWAGPGYGLVCLPRVGDEVIVDFIDGDPNLPIVIGRVHNAVNVRPFNGPAERTISVWRSRSSPGGGGFNQVLLDDAAGAERLELHAERDFKSESGRMSVTTVGQNEKKRVGGSSSTSIGGSQTISSGSTSHNTGPYKLQAQRIEETAVEDFETTAPIRRENSVTHEITTESLTVASVTEVAVTTADFYAEAPKIVLITNFASIVLDLDKVHIFSLGSIEIEGPSIKLSSTGTIEINGAVVDIKGKPIKLNS